MIMSCSISTSSGSRASGSMVRLTSSISPLTVTLTMPPPAEASTVWDLRFSCAAASCSCILRACFIICCMFIPAMMAPLRAAARQAARAAGARRDFQTQKSYHGAGQASGADTLPQSIYMSLSVTHAQDYARSNYARLHNYLKLHLAELEPGSLCVGLQGYMAKCRAAARGGTHGGWV